MCKAFPAFLIVDLFSYGCKSSPETERVTAFVGGTTTHHRFWKTTHAEKTQNPEQEKNWNRGRAYIKDHEIPVTCHLPSTCNVKWHFALDTTYLLWNGVGRVKL